MTTTWTPAIEHLEPATNPDTLADVRPLLERMVSAYSPAIVARLLGVDSIAHNTLGPRRS